MRSSPLFLALAVLATAACGGDSSTTGGRCPQTPCATGETCQADGTCAASIATNDGGIATCTAGDVKPVGTSTLGTTASTTDAYVAFHQAGVQVGTTISFPVASPAASITIIEQSSNAPDTATFNVNGTSYVFDNTAVPHTVKSPDGTTINFDDVQDGQIVLADYSTLAAYFFSDSPAAGTMTIPNTTKGVTLANGGGLPTGTWTALISDYAYECSAGIGKGQTFSSCISGSTASTYDVTVIVKPVSGGGIPTSGTLDVVVNFVATSVGGKPLNASEAPADTDLIRMVNTLQSFYAKQGITANVTYRDAPSAVQQRYATGVNIDQSGACSDLSQLLTNGATGNVLNIFMVPTLVETAGTQQITTVGLDGTIPGPASIGGTVASGAVVSAADLRSGHANCLAGFDVTCGADETAYIIAHEAGHFLGLYHVTEKYGFQFDPLAGTPTCKCTSCSPHASTCSDPAQGTPPSTADQVPVSECLNSSTGCLGGDNLMFWLLATGSTGALLDEQGQVMRANPAVHP